jgi:methionine synthase I (cobalamin-dependent)
MTDVYRNCSIERLLHERILILGEVMGTMIQQRTQEEGIEKGVSVHSRS